MGVYETVVEISVDNRLLEAVSNKVKAWDALCNCTDEFGEDAHVMCGELLDADDAAMIALKSQYTGYLRVSTASQSKK